MLGQGGHVAVWVKCRMSNTEYPQCVKFEIQMQNDSCGPCAILITTIS